MKVCLILLSIFSLASAVATIEKVEIKLLDPTKGKFSVKINPGPPKSVDIDAESFVEGKDITVSFTLTEFIFTFNPTLSRSNSLHSHSSTDNTMNLLKASRSAFVICLSRNTPSSPSSTKKCWKAEIWQQRVQSISSLTCFTDSPLKSLKCQCPSHREASRLNSMERFTSKTRTRRCSSQTFTSLKRERRARW